MNLLKPGWIIYAVILFFVTDLSAQSSFVSANHHQFFIFGHPYYYIGANYWYGGLIGNDKKGKKRVKKELDFLVSKGVTNLRVMAGAEGVGQIDGVPRVEPALQPQAGVFKKNLLKGLDFLLAEMGKRNMKAVIVLSNNWEWSGGFLQYLNWNGLIADSVLQRKLSWDELRDYVSRFYQCAPCNELYKAQVKLVVTRTNTITGRKYKDDDVIMAWEIVNEPRPMRTAVIPDFIKWVKNTALYIKSLDKNHLVTTGSEGEMGSENMDVFREVHADSNIDYATIHIWPKNWGWFKDTAIAKSLTGIIESSNSYINRHATIMRQIDKPLVIEEFGLPRDNHSYLVSSSTSLRDRYYETIFNTLLISYHQKSVITGCNFWSFSGTGRPSYQQLLWKRGDDILGDPPVEEQGLNSVFDTDGSTWKVIESFTKKINNDDKIEK
jgi:mannan endo-1,4-beta-mannosidase